MYVCMHGGGERHRGGAYVCVCVCVKLAYTFCACV